MDVGQVFSDRLHGITIKDVGQDAAGVTLAITVPGDTLPPSAPSGLSAVADGTTVLLRWSAAIDDFSVDDYVVKRDGAQVGTPVTTTSRLRPRARHDGRLHRGGGRRGRQCRARCRRQPGDSRHDAAGRAAQGDREGDEGRPGPGRLGCRDRQRPCRQVSHPPGGRLIATDHGALVRRPVAEARARLDVTYSVVAVDLAGNAGPPGKARPVRAALLRKLARLELQDREPDARRACARAPQGHASRTRARSVASASAAAPGGTAGPRPTAPSTSAWPRTARSLPRSRCATSSVASARDDQRALARCPRRRDPDLTLGMAHTAPAAEIWSEDADLPDAIPARRGGSMARAAGASARSRARAPARALRSCSEAGSS